MSDIEKLLKKFSPEEIAAKIGVSGKTIYNWKNGATKPRRRDEQALRDLALQLTKAKTEGRV